MSAGHQEDSLRLRSEDGSVLIVILAMTFVLSLLVSASFVTARRSIQVADAEEELHGALAAAEAGLEDYLFRLNAVDAYWRYGATAGGLPAPPDGNAAFGGWVPVPGGASAAEFTYTADASRMAAEGVVELRSTGRAEGRQRTIEAVLKPHGVLDHAYVTEFETLSPSAYATDADMAWAQRNCAVHRWRTERPTTGRPSDPTRGCAEVRWTAGDVVDGPVHTNDRIRMGGNVTWLDAVSTSDPRVPRYDTNGFTASFALPLDPSYRSMLSLPTSTEWLRSVAESGGCIFTGPTALDLRPDGTLRVQSPRTIQSGAGCGSWTAGVDTPQTIAIPAAGVVYVQDVPTDPADPNHSAGCGSGGNGLGYPIAGDIGRYDCRAGDVFVEGVLDGRLTVAGRNDVIITWHIDHAGTDDVLGLVAGDAVEIYHPVSETCASGSCTSANLVAGPGHSTTLTDVRVAAAVLATGDSLRVQHHDRGAPLGDVVLTGSVAQVFRGPLGTVGAAGQLTGYGRDFRYDTRLRGTGPPAFVQPGGATWRPVTVAEQFGAP